MKKDLGKPETAFQWNPYTVGSNNIEFNTAADKPWNKMSDYDLDAGMMHELSHQYDTYDDDEHKGPLINAHHIAVLMNYDKDIRNYIYVRKFVYDAEKKCGHACGSPPSGGVATS